MISVAHVADGTAVTSSITVPFKGAYWYNQAEYMDIVVSAVTGTSPTLTVTYQTWNAATNAWVTRFTTSAITAAGTTRIPIAYGSVDVPSQLILTTGGTTPHFTLGAHHRDN